MTDIINAQPTTTAWHGFTGTGWRERIDVADFIRANFTPYAGDRSFLATPDR